jgi:hypothetical protein
MMQHGGDGAAGEGARVDSGQEAAGKGERARRVMVFRGRANRRFGGGCGHRSFNCRFSGDAREGAVKLLGIVLEPAAAKVYDDQC